MSQPVPHDENQFDGNINKEDISNTPDDSHIGYFLEVDLIYPPNIKEKQRVSPLLLKKNKINQSW